MSGGYSSPPCYASEVAPDYFGTVPALTRDELLALLCRLLADERAGAAAAAAFANDCERGSAAWNRFAALRGGGTKNCMILAELIARLDGNAGRAVDDIPGSAQAVQGLRARLEFVNCGQRRLARAIHDALPNIEQDFVRRALIGMEDSHLLDIEACEALIETL
ncbi:MAG TPA: DUF6306 domain-containing protein [Burkholderiales bacterium]|nr:DUF6306 domain-containing protein [Burkholderiales bacterium]